MRLTKEEGERLISILSDSSLEGDHVVKAALAKIRRSLSVRKAYGTLK